MKEITSCRFVRQLLMLLICVALPIALTAQSTTLGAIGGTVSDVSKAVVPNAKVTVVNNGTGETKEGAADSFGKFRVIALQPGTYTVSVEAPSFSGYKSSGVVVEVGRVTELEIALKAGASNEVVEVTSEAPTVNTIQQDFSSNIDQTAINNLPINGRRWSNFALLTPGATTDGGFGLISFRGVSGLLNNNTVDGGDNNQAFFSEERGRTRASYTVSQSSIREFQVNTSNYSAEYGRAAGAVVNSVTKSGTNKIHGEAFYYIRDNTLGATNPFTTHTVQQNGSYVSEKFKPEDRRHQFGGNFGGALIKDKLFYFFNYDGQRRNFPGVAQASNPGTFFSPIVVQNPSKHIGSNGAVQPLTCSATSGTNIITDGEYLYCKGISQDQANAALGFLVGETGTVARTGDQDILFPKIDYKVNDKHTLSLSYNRMRWYSPAGVQTQPTVTYGVASFGNDGVKTDMFIARLTSTLSSSMTNEFRYQWGRDFEYQSSQAPSAAEAAWGLATSYGNRPPYITITNGINIGRANFLERTAYPDEKRNQFADTMSYATGHHLLKWGFDLDRNDDLMDNLYSGGGTFAYTGTYARASFIQDLSNYKNGTPTANYGSFTQAFGPTKLQFQTWDYAGFFQDDWKVLPRLTLNLGVRYEFESMPPEQYTNPYIDFANHIHKDWNNIGPRVGFAWDVYGNGKTALRGGYGVYYGRVNNGAIAGALFNNGGIGTQTTYSNIKPASGPKFPNVYSADPGTFSSKPNAFYMDPNLQNPQIQQADLILEQELAHNTVLSVSYLLSLGRELPNFYDMNIAPATTTASYSLVGGPFAGQTLKVPYYTTRINSAALGSGRFGSVIDEISNVNSNYNALAVQLNRKMTGSLQWLMNYTWSHALDNGQNSLTQTASYANVYDPYNLGLEYGNSNFDRRHKFVASAVYQPNYFKNHGAFAHAVLDGWGLAPLVNLSTGSLYTESISGNGPSGYVSGGINGSGGNFRLAPLVGRNAWKQPMFANVDMRLSRKFTVKEGQSLEFLAEAFNLFNHQIVTGVNQTMYTISGTTMTYNNNFRSVTQAGTNLYRERQIQFALRYAF